MAWRETFSVPRVMDAFGVPGSQPYDDAPGGGGAPVHGVHAACSWGSPLDHGRDCGRVEGGEGFFRWRRRAVGELSPQAALGSRCCFAHILEAPDRDGAPVVVWRLGLVDLSGIAREEAVSQVRLRWLRCRGREHA